MVDGYRRPEHSICDDTNEQEDRDHNRRNKVFHRLSLIKTTRSQDGGECCRPDGKAGEQHHRVQYFLSFAPVCS